MNQIILLFLFSSLTLGTSIVILSQHWFTIWLGLELSTLSLIPLINTNMNPRSNEATIKYFLIQAFSAALLLSGVTLNLWYTASWSIESTINNFYSYSIILIAIIIKLGLAPCHFWLPDVLGGLNFLNGIIIASWQKIAPLFILLNLSYLLPHEGIILSSILSILIGGWGGLNQTSIRKILAFSSISHLGWIALTSFYSPNASLMIFIFYLINNTLIFLICSTNNLIYLSNLNKCNISLYSSILIAIALLSLGGLPPLGGFINKIIPLTLIFYNNNLILAPALFLGSLTSLYYYLRIIFNTSITLFPNNSLNLLIINSNTPNNLNSFISILSPFPIFGLTFLSFIYSYL
uniref:NADH-ubiquinone oxidoreductase chain 2 n=1 Tax=Ocnus glacialis TaxID=3074281 RepID=A0AA51UDL0_9ECHN|nr:NADH dehydrogenase subunit 2 [Ocnus glacialis]WMW14025.1 NADH dehydrogenase subunit 2 [Ocnus glacialis]